MLLSARSQDCSAVSLVKFAQRLANLWFYTNKSLNKIYTVISRQLIEMTCPSPVTVMLGIGVKELNGTSQIFWSALCIHVGISNFSFVEKLAKIFNVWHNPGVNLTIRRNAYQQDILANVCYILRRRNTISALVSSLPHWHWGLCNAVFPMANRGKCPLTQLLV